RLCPGLQRNVELSPRVSTLESRFAARGQALSARGPDRLTLTSSASTADDVPSPMLRAARRKRHSGIRFVDRLCRAEWPKETPDWPKLTLRRPPETGITFSREPAKSSASPRRRREGTNSVGQTHRCDRLSVSVSPADQAPPPFVHAACGGPGDRLPRSEALHLSHAARPHRPSGERAEGIGRTPGRHRRRDGLGHASVP